MGVRSSPLPRPGLSCTSSVAFPHRNCRAEIGVKTMKRLITDNTGPKGELDTDAVQIAILQYRNTPDPDTNISPAMCVFGRPTRDFILVIPGKYRPHETWRETLKAREEALRKRHVRTAETWAEHTKRLPPLAVGDFVRVQNQTGPHPNKWDKTGSIVEVRQHDQYAIKIDGSGRITLRNRKFLRKFSPVHHDRPIRSIYNYLAIRITGLTPVVIPQLPDDPATPTWHKPPPTVTSARTPHRKTTPDAVTPTTPGRPHRGARFFRRHHQPRTLRELHRHRSQTWNHQHRRLVNDDPPERPACLPGTMTTPWDN